MSIKRLTITKLFGQFDYDIPLDNPEGIRIITGPNGYGKTMILKILDSLFKEDAYFFEQLVFETITIYLNNDNEIRIRKETITEDDMREFEATIVHFYTKNEFICNVFEITYESRMGEYYISNANVKKIFNAIKPKFISVDRTYQQGTNNYNFHLGHNHSLSDCQQKLSEIFNTLEKESELTKRKLDATYPIRMIKEAVNISKKDYENRFDKIDNIQKKLNYYGFNFEVQTIPEYEIESAKILSVYLSDIERKFAIFENLILRLDLFVSILNTRKFSDKKIFITNTARGNNAMNLKFEFINSVGYSLNDNHLSTGELHQIVLLFEFLFDTDYYYDDMLQVEKMIMNTTTLFLIDEPEISLHVAWQHSFIDDLVEIMKLQKIQILVATHSPQIISTYGDLAYDLYYSQQKTVEI